MQISRLERIAVPRSSSSMGIASSGLVRSCRVYVHRHGWLHTPRFALRPVRKLDSMHRPEYDMHAAP